MIKVKLTYPPKILLAWAEAIKGNAAIRDWLIKNGYPELGMFTFALRNKRDARDWLVENKFLHLMALISGAEGDEDAVKWLVKHGFSMLAKVAMAGDRESDVFQEIRKQDTLFAKIAREIMLVKIEIEQNNWDYHRMSGD